MDATDYMKGGYLTPQDVRVGDIIVFRNEGEPTESFGRQAIEFIIALLSGAEFKTTPNKRSLRALAEVWGAETRGWIGKKAIVDVKQEEVNGEMKMVIYLTPEDDIISEPQELNPAPVKDSEIPVCDDPMPAAPKTRAGIDTSVDANKEAQLANQDQA